jgi:hypothetical protein
LATAPAADTTIGTSEIGEIIVILTTMIPKNTFNMPMVLRIAQLSSKYGSIDIVPVDSEFL